ncbi:MAG: bifunctional 3-(3-hydroxy-phenyl)propionate/3-hydroxycinnamic acid hydroxylase [Alcaligenaceae bacterium]|nr:bifunctional 3-(3-hydroxy-phenyl)propionate/3-hydroxycinnamic acid hydroxylase [Alcaligenaceae bacterium]
MSEIINVPVVVVGAGPVGVTIANLLGVYQVETLVLERSLDIFNFPRAVGLDDEALRTLQSANLVDSMLKDMIQNVPMRMYTADKKCIAEILPSTKEFGWFRRNLFSQPLAEATMREGLEKYPHVTLKVGQEVEQLEQDDTGVTLQVKDEAGKTYTVRTQYVIGADGGRSTIREKILKLSFEGKTHPHKWVVIECDDDPLDAPYTALHCEPDRPYVCLRLPYGLRRWEFMLFPGEDGEQMLQPEKVNELLGKHVENPEALNVIRARVYTHNSRVAGTFVKGRVCIAGDAAHLTPPWIGQGLNAGMRDACNLAWKVAYIVQGKIKPGLLESYDQERHEHAKAMIDLADTFGSMLSQTNKAIAKMRDLFLLTFGQIPKVKDYVLQMKFKPMPRYSKGIVINSGNKQQDSLVGKMFIQPLVEMENNMTVKLDDVLGKGFALISWHQDAISGLPEVIKKGLKQIDCSFIVADRMRSNTAEKLKKSVSSDVDVVEDTENALHFWFQNAGVDWVLVRPDRYVAALGKKEETVQVLESFVDQFVAA